MKKINIIHFLIIGLIIFCSCGTKKESETADGTRDSLGVVSTGDGTYCIWDKAALWDEPMQKGAKYLAGLTLGEKVTYLEESKTDGEGDKAKEFLKVRLNDGKEGWTQANLLAVNSKPAVFTSECKIYSRPDLLTVTEKTFSPFDFVAITEEKGEWLHVKGKRTGGKWIEEAWIRTGSTTDDEKDIAIASYVNRAKSKYAGDDTKLKEELEKIRDNSDLQGGSMHNALATLIQEKYYPIEIESESSEAVEYSEETSETEVPVEEVTETETEAEPVN